MKQFTDIDFDNVATGINVPTPTLSHQIAPKSYVDSVAGGGGGSYSAISVTASTHTVGTEDFIVGSGTNAIAVTIPIARTKPLTIKHVGTQDMTIVLSTSVIDDTANLILRGNKKNAVTLHFQGGKAWIT